MDASAHGRQDAAPVVVRVTRLPGRQADPAAATLDLSMTADDRRRVRRPVVTSTGVRIELALPTGTVLPVGAVVCTVNGVDVVVRAAPETVLEIRPTSITQAVQVGHLIGTMHRDLIVEDDVIVTLHAAPLERRLRDLADDVQTAVRPFHGRAAGEHAHG